MLPMGMRPFQTKLKPRLYNTYTSFAIEKYIQKYIEQIIVRHKGEWKIFYALKYAFSYNIINKS